MALNVFLVDAGRPELNVRFRLRIEGQGIRIETKPEFLPPPTSLTGGVPLQLISADLAPYFESRNLNFTGISQRQYEQRGALPEGLYQFCFEVLEYNRGVKISNTSCAAAWLILNDPPIVNLPRDGEKVRIQEPQQVIFQWTPRHTGSPNSAFSTEYDFKMVEIWPPTRNPNDAILTSPPVFETTTNATTLIYGPAETPLEPGRRYAIQLKARSVTGVEELNLFKNNGLSQVYTFQYGDACNVPTNIVGEAPGPSRIALSWAGATNQTGYKVRYRPASPSPAERGAGLPAGQAGGEVWYTDNIFLTDHEIKSLQPNTRYEYQLLATCGTFESTWSNIASITTPDVEGIAYSCGLPMAPFNLDPSQLIDVIKVGDVIKAGDFDVKISKVTGSAGTFSGEGVIEVSYFNKAKVKAEFTNIVVNKELRMVNGFMNVTGAGVDIIPAGVMDFMDKLDEALAQVDSLLNEYEANLPQQFDPASFVADTAIRVNGTITNVFKDGSGSVVIVDANGNRTTVPAGTSAAVTDSAGNGYIVDKKGNIHKTTAEIAAKAGNREYNLALKFDASPDQAFGFDVKHDPLAAKYERLEGDKFAPWKSVATGRTDAVLAILEGSGFDKSKIRFEQAGSPLTPNTSAPNSSTANAYELRVNGTSDGIEEGLLALYTPPDTTKKEQVLGKLNVATYDEIQKTVVIVPVNGNKYPYSEANLRTQLNKIYGQAVVKWNVQMAPEGFVVPGIDPFDDGGSGLLSNYSPDMRKVVDAYNTDPAPDTYYLFLVKNPKAGKLAGYMPRGKEFGFIFTDQAGSEQAIIHTMAHELAHGAFNLRHTFAEEKYTIPQGSTDNLMDYTQAFGTKLYKHQWDQMRYPEIVIGLFEGDEDAAYKAWAKLSGDVISSIPGLENKSISFLSPTGSIITLPPNTRDFTFNNGYLIGFTVESTRYIAFEEKDAKNFKGYFYDAVEVQSKSYNTSQSIPFEGKLESVTQQPLIIFVLPDQTLCGVYKVFSATYQPSVESLNKGGIGTKTQISTSISSLTQILSGVTERGSVSDRINCLSGRLKEIYKFIIEHYDFYKKPVNNGEKDELINELRRFSIAYISGLDTIPSTIAGRADVKMREMLSYGLTEFVGKLKETKSSLMAPTTLVVEFEDIERLRDTYLMYQIAKKIDVDCKFAEDLQAAIDKQITATGQVSFNLDFISALSKTTYSIILGNESFELLNCLLKNLRAPESLYNPNRLDYQLQGFVQELFENYLGLGKNELVSAVGQGMIQYPIACNCGAWNSLIDLVYGLSDLGAGLTQPPQDIAKKSKEYFEKIKNSGFSGMGNGVWELIKEHHGYSGITGFDSYRATYAGCYDVVFVASFFVGAGELKAISKATDLGDIAKILAKSAKAYPATISQIASRTAQFTSRTVRNFTLEILEKLPPSLFVQLPADAKAIILATAFNEGVRLASITDDGIKFLVPVISSTERGTEIIYQSTKPIRNVDTGKDVLVKFVKKEDGSYGYVIDDIVTGANNDLASFVNKTLTQKLDEITTIWNTKYPISDMLGGRSFFEDIMGQYRYTKSTGWNHTGDISFNVKGIDFYKGTQQGSEIYASTAVSMKTTIKTNVDEWLNYTSVQDNIRFLKEGLTPSGLIDSNNSLKMFITNAEIHIYMPKANITDALKTSWMNKLNTIDSKIKFEVKALEDFIQ